MNINIDNALVEYQTRKQLLGRLRAEKQRLMTAVEKFYSQPMRGEDNAAQTLEEVIATFDSVINAGDWNSSLFLRNTISPLKQMREQAQQLYAQLRGQISNEAVPAPALASGMIKVYISIFQHKAHNVKDWETQLHALPHYVLGRPIYRDETAVQQALRAKLVQTSDAYVCVGVPENAVQTGEFHPLQNDKQGNHLLQLVPGAVKSENILEFVYQDRRYHFLNGQLVEKI
jgi:intracellular multiplication protein IcmQ